MLTVGEAFNKFKSRLEITATEQSVASRRQKALRTQVESEIGVNRDFLIGAYATGNDHPLRMSTRGSESSRHPRPIGSTGTQMSMAFPTRIPYCCVSGRTLFGIDVLGTATRAS